MCFVISGGQQERGGTEKKIYEKGLSASLKFCPPVYLFYIQGEQSFRCVESLYNNGLVKKKETNFFYSTLVLVFAVSTSARLNFVFPVL